MYKYDDDLDEVLKYQTDDIVKRMKEKAFPFDDQRVWKYFDKFTNLTKK